MQICPKVTIVTVCYNAVALIESTIISVLSQSYANIEYIIIDGGSTDGTVDIIKKYANRLAYWVSEKDQGIYDAMNKGVNFATGQWINFMNAGDSFSDVDAVEKIFKEEIPTSIRVVYGDTIAVMSAQKKVHIKALPVSRINRGIIACHQSVFVSLVDKGDIYFDIKYKLSADYNQIYNICYKYGPNSFLYHAFPVSLYEFENGLSAVHKTLCLQERFRIHVKYKLWTSCCIDFLMILLSKLGLK